MSINMRSTPAVTDHQCLQLLLEVQAGVGLPRYSIHPNIITFDSFNVIEHHAEGGSSVVNEQWYPTPAEAVRAAVRKLKGNHGDRG